jgi:hypothetical protein
MQGMRPQLRNETEWKQGRIRKQKRIKMSDIATIVYDHLERDATWKVNNTIQVNPIPFDDPVPPPSLITSGPLAGALAFKATYSKNMAGALISTGLPWPPIGAQGRSFQYTALNVRMFIPAYPAGTIMRKELDYKLTFASGLQANVSTQINKSNGQWQLDPTGKTWANTGYVPTTDGTGKSDMFQIRAWSDSLTVWSVLGLQCNNEFPFTPGAQFQNVPLIQTNWAESLRPQLQWEGANAPFTAEIDYQHVQVVVSDFPIPWLDPASF